MKEITNLTKKDKPFVVLAPIILCVEFIFFLSLDFWCECVVKM